MTSDDRYVVSLDEESLARAQSLKGVLAWVNAKLKDVLPGATLDVYLEDEGDNRAGDIRLTFDTVENTLAQSGDLDVDNLGLGDFENLEVTADLSAQIDTALDLSAKFNVYDMQAEYAAQAEDEKSVLAAVLKSAALTDMQLTADFDARTTELTGAAKLGLIEIELDQTDPSRNFAVFNSTLDVTVVGGRQRSLWPGCLLRSVSDDLWRAGADRHRCGRRTDPGGCQQPAKPRQSDRPLQPDGQYRHRRGRMRGDRGQHQGQQRRSP